MLSDTLQDSDYKSIINNLVQHLEKRGYQHIKADLDEYETPSKLTRKGSKESFIPNLTASKDDGSKYYFEIVTKDKQNQDKLISKWSMLSVFAEMRDGKLFLVVPNGKLRYTNRLLKENEQINADILQLKNL